MQSDFGGEVTPLYNGNITQTSWKTDSDNIVRSYGYKYDKLNRLKKAIYDRDAVVTHSYDETLDYDKNGNILKLERNGYVDAPSPGLSYPIDNLVYTYGNNSNQLVAVSDETNSTEGFRDGNQNGADFSYDDYGNMTSDLNKKIHAIYYNHLNLPVKIKFNGVGENEINYLYNALGVKLGKIVVRTTEEQGTMTNETAYLTGFQYLDCKLQFFPTAEGYVSVTSENKFNYVYNYTDHLGNIRLSYTSSGSELKILEENHYYPFGLKHSNYNVDKVDFAKGPDGISIILHPVERNKYQYKYNGKEFQDELGLGWYDYQARNYDPALGRWMNIDPLAETSRRFSPYTYCLNNPLRFIDPDGMEADDIIVSGDDAKRATKALDKSSSLKITRNSDSGKLSAKGEAKTDYDKKLLSAINDTKITVNLKANSVEKIAVDGKVGEITLGAYGGSQVVNGKTEALQMVNMDQIDKVEKAGVMTAGQIVGHEVMESYIAAHENGGANKANSINGDKAYDVGHKAAISLDPNFVNLISSQKIGNSKILIFDNSKSVILD